MSIQNLGDHMCVLLGVCSSVTIRPSVLWFQDTHRGLFIQQLRPTQNLQPRIKLKLFGHSGSGKTTLVESLKCGLLRSFFRRRRPRLSSTNSTRFPPSPLASKPAGRLPPPPAPSSPLGSKLVSRSGKRGGFDVGAWPEAGWFPQCRWPLGVVSLAPGLVPTPLLASKGTLPK